MEVSGTLMALGKAGRLSDAAFSRIQSPLMDWWAIHPSCYVHHCIAGSYLIPQMMQHPHPSHPAVGSGCKLSDRNRQWQVLETHQVALETF